MKILFDTSVLVAAIVGPHPLHPSAFTWLKRAKSKEFEMIVAGHTLAELYAVLTTLPVSPKISPAMARNLISNDVEALAKIVSLQPREYSLVIKHMAELGLSGGCVYDAVIAASARKYGADRLLTFNTDDFMRVWPEGAGLITTP